MPVARREIFDLRKKVGKIATGFDKIRQDIAKSWQNSGKILTKSKRASRVGWQNSRFERGFYEWLYKDSFQ